MTPAIQTEIRVQSETEAREQSLNLTHIFKKMQAFPEEMRRPALVAAFDLGASKWQAGLLSDRKKKSLTLTGCGLERQALDAIFLEMRRLVIKDTRDVVACFEIGRNGLWLAEYLAVHGFSCVVLSPAVLCDGSRKPKTDRLDSEGLAIRLMRFFDGSLEAGHVHLPPPPEVQERRAILRRRADAVDERTRYRNKFKSVLARNGVDYANLDVAEADVTQFRAPLSRPLPSWEIDELRCLQRHVRLAEEDIADADRKMLDIVKAIYEAQEAGKAVHRLDAMLVKLFSLRGIGIQTAWTLVCEQYWRHFGNVRQVSAATGLVDIPRCSGSTSRGAGISRRSNHRLRGSLVELAWMWRRHQPESALSKWFEERTAAGVSARRLKKVAIVAVARKLAVALWKYLEHDMLPEGAMLKAGASGKTKSKAARAKSA